MEIPSKSTERVGMILRHAEAKARKLNFPQVDTGMILWALACGENGVGPKLLVSLGVDLAKLRSAARPIVPNRGKRYSGAIELSPEAEKVMGQAKKEAAALGHHYIGTEHLLLALISNAEGDATRILAKFGVTEAMVRAKIKELLAFMAPKGMAPRGAA